MLLTTKEKMLPRQNMGENRRWWNIDEVHHKYNDKYTNLIANIFNYGLMDGDLHLTNFDNQHLGVTDFVSVYLEKSIDVDDRLFNFEKCIKNFANIDDKVNIIIEDYKPKTETKYDNKTEFLAL